MRISIKEFFTLAKESYRCFNDDKAPRLGAALAYYTVFSMTPFLIVLLAIAGLVFDKIGIGARDQILAQLNNTFGNAGGKLIGTMLDNANHHGSGTVAGIIGTLTLLVGCGAVFGQLQDALNTIWRAEPKPGLGIWGLIRARFLSFAMVLGTGFLMLVSLALSAVLQGFSVWLNGVLPVPEFVLATVNTLVALGVTTALFAMIFKLLPDTEIDWNDVWVGALFTAVLFGLGKFALGLYLEREAPGSTYGAAGSLVLILLWVYYAAQILFFGAEFTKVHALKNRTA